MSHSNQGDPHGECLGTLLWVIKKHDTFDLTESFNIESGVIQGSKFGQIVFIIYINDLLQQLEYSKLGVHFCNIVILGLVFADEIIPRRYG